MANPSLTAKRGWRLLRRLAAGLLLLVVLLCIAGAMYNALALHHLRKLYPPPGQFYSVNGHSMHLYCSGSGSPTVVLESGGAEGFLVWGKVQPVLSRVTRVCSYDRAGLGWSDPVPGPRDSDHIAKQLHALLTKANIAGPLVLMGHSAGGLHIRVFASRYPKDVVGMIFVDATTPPDGIRLPASVAALDHHSTVQMAIFKAMIALGIPRIMGQCSVPPPGFDATANLWRANACTPAYVTAYQREKCWSAASRSEAARSAHFGNLPVLIFSRDNHLPRPPQLPSLVSTRDWQLGNVAHDRMQANLMKLSTHSRRIIVKGSGHYIHFQRAELLNREVIGFIQQRRNGTGVPDSGTTITE